MEDEPPVAKNRRAHSSRRLVCLHGDIRCPYGTPQIKAQGSLKEAEPDGERSRAGADPEKSVKKNMLGKARELLK